MNNKFKRITNYIIYAILTNAIYGFLLYNLCTWLTGYSLIYAYFGNFILIILGLILDELSLKMFQSKWLIIQIKNNKDIETNSKIMKFMFDGFISFKLMLYVFYILIMIISEIIELNSIIINKNLENFIFANRYSILVLIALDQLIGQFSKDRERINEVSKKFEKNWKEIIN